MNKERTDLDELDELANDSSIDNEELTSKEIELSQREAAKTVSTGISGPGTASGPGSSPNSHVLPGSGGIESRLVDAKMVLERTQGGTNSGTQTTMQFTSHVVPESIGSIENAASGTLAALEKRKSLASKRQRQVYFRHTPSDVPVLVVEKMLVWFSIGEMPITTITSKVNKTLVTGGLKEIEPIDTYAILFSAMKRGSIADREPAAKGELSLTQFSEFFKSWKAGLTLAECVSSTGRIQSSAYCSPMFRAMNVRHKEMMLRAAGNLSTGNSASRAKEAMNVKDIFSVAERRVIGGRFAFVLFADKLNEQLLQILFDAVPLLRVAMETSVASDSIDESEAPMAGQKYSLSAVTAMQGVNAKPAPDQAPVDDGSIESSIRNRHNSGISTTQSGMKRMSLPKANEEDYKKVDGKV